MIKYDNLHLFAQNVKKLTNEIKSISYVRIKKETPMRTILISVLLISFISLFGQNKPDHILRVYSDWITNFEKTSVDFSELIPGGPPKDGIPAIVNPKFESNQSASDWVSEREPVISLEINGEAKAYPLQILMFHEIANDELGSKHVLVSFCPLCYSAIVYNRELDNEVHRFGVSGLLRNSDLVMYDQKTESFWEQFTGEAIVGEMLGRKLEPIPSQIISFEQFVEMYPNGKILSKETGFNRPYGKNPYTGYDDIDKSPFAFTGEIDDRLPPNEKVIAVKINDEYKAYPYSITWTTRVINDEFNGEKIVVFHLDGAVSSMDEREIAKSKEMGSTGVYNRIINDRELTFRIENRKIIKDDQTNSTWSITGKAIEGDLKGEQLKKEFHGDYFSFALFAFAPDTEIFIPLESSD